MIHQFRLVNLVNRDFCNAEFVERKVSWLCFFFSFLKIFWEVPLKIIWDVSCTRTVCIVQRLSSPSGSLCRVRILQLFLSQLGTWAFRCLFWVSITWLTRLAFLPYPIVCLRWLLTAALNRLGRDRYRIRVSINIISLYHHHQYLSSLYSN